MAGGKNSSRVNHDIDQKQNTFRDDNLKQILNDVNEDMEGIGFSEVVYKSPPQQVFVDKIIVWETISKVKKRAEIVFNYGTSFPFIETITKTNFKEDGSAGDSQVVATFNYNANKTIQNVLVTPTRL